MIVDEQTQDVSTHRVFGMNPAGTGDMEGIIGQQKGDHMRLCIPPRLHSHGNTLYLILVISSEMG